MLHNIVRFYIYNHYIKLLHISAQTTYYVEFSSLRNNKFVDVSSIAKKSGRDLQCKDTVEENPFDPRQINLLTSFKSDDLLVAKQF